MKYYVYLLLYPDGRPFYVGKGTGNRLDFHEREARKGHRCEKCAVIRGIWRAGGAVGRQIVLATDDEQAVYTKEQELIAQYGIETLVNRTLGGIGAKGYRHTPAQNAAKSARQRGHKQSPATIAARIQHQIGRSRPNLAGEHSPAAKLTQALADEMRVLYLTGEYTQAELGQQFGVSEGTAGSVLQGVSYRSGPESQHLIEQCQALIALRRTKADRRCLTQAQAEQIRQLHSTGNYSGSELARLFSVSPMTISDIIRGKRYV